MSKYLIHNSEFSVEQYNPGPYSTIEDALESIQQLALVSWDEDGDLDEEIWTRWEIYSIYSKVDFGFTIPSPEIEVSIRKSERKTPK